MPSPANAPQTSLAEELIGAAPPSPAGPIEAGELAELAPPPSIPLALLAQTLRFSQRQIEFVFRARREFGEVFRMRGTIPGGPVITSHPDHVRSLFTASPELAPSLTGESPLRPILGPNSVLTVRLPPRALARQQAGHLQVDPLRRWHPPPPRRRSGDGRAARRPRDHGPPP